MRGRGSRLSLLRAPLRHRDFRLLWIAQVFSQSGDWAGRVALGVLVFQRTGSPTVATLASVANLLPWVGIGQVLATLGDRYPRRRVMVVSDIVRAVAYATMLLAEPAWLLLAIAFVAGLAAPPFEAARSALMVASVPEDEYGEALSLSSITYQTAIVAGALAGGGLLGAFGAEGALLSNAASFLLSAAFLARLTNPGIADSHDSSFVPVAAARLVFGDLLLRRATLLMAAVSACGVAVEAVIPVYVLDVLGARESFTGVVVAAVPVGTVVALAIIPRRGDEQHLLLTGSRVAILTAAASILVFAFDPPLPLVLAGFVGVGAMFASLIGPNVVLGRRLPDSSRAAAFGIVNGTLMAAGALAAAVAGGLATLIGTRQAVIAALTTAVAVGLVSEVTLRRNPGRSPDEESALPAVTTPT